MIKIMAVDDHPVVLKGIENILSTQSDMSIVAQAGSVSECMELIGKVDCEVVILDISLPDGSGFDILEALKARNPKLQIIILSMLPDDKFAIRAFENGAAGYINKSTVADELVDAIRAVASGNKYITPEMAQKLARHVDRFQQEKLPHEALSEREYQVMLMLASGMLLKDIGAELGINLKTVSTYKDRIKNKMKLKTKTELIKYAIRNKLI
ncbi:response regulator transcription factor [Candidatus Magnetobacterium casense]|uniref:Response regulator transcription factor n=1 Tax=Candidatus Magnetobacterium casense TaxID=1455061 RepID=A0ABS6RYG1_9BACT|nr:response regulator transcription factor [Candidatus Magnetobacterium casensis]MBV6341687.1 response regulator transcription factor [Candidatus Magnetobacterium casensis]